VRGRSCADSLDAGLAGISAGRAIGLGMQWGTESRSAEGLTETDHAVCFLAHGTDSPAVGDPARLPATDTAAADKIGEGTAHRALGRGPQADADCSLAAVQRADLAGILGRVAGSSRNAVRTQSRVLLRTHSFGRDPAVRKPIRAARPRRHARAAQLATAVLTGARGTARETIVRGALAIREPARASVRHQQRDRAGSQRRNCPASFQ
jgi:hypothetical protein